MSRDNLKALARWILISFFALGSALFWCDVLTDSFAPSNSSSGDFTRLDWIEGGLTVFGVIAFFVVPVCFLAPKWWFRVSTLQASVPAFSGLVCSVRLHSTPDAEGAIYAGLATFLFSVVVLAWPVCALRLKLLRRAEQKIVARSSLLRDIITPQTGVWPPPPSYEPPLVINPAESPADIHQKS